MVLCATERPSIPEREEATPERIVPILLPPTDKTTVPAATFANIPNVVTCPAKELTTAGSELNVLTTASFWALVKPVIVKFP